MWGFGVPEDDARAVQLVTQSANHNNAWGYFCLGSVISSGGVSREIFELTRQASDLDCLPALYQVGKCYSNGLGVERDTAKAWAYHNQAAARGCPFSADYVAKCYQYGYGIPKNQQQADNWIRVHRDMIAHD